MFATMLSRSPLSALLVTVILLAGIPSNLFAASHPSKSAISTTPYALSVNGDNLTDGMVWLRDEKHQLTPDSALVALQQHGKQNQRGHHPSFGFERATIWLLLNITNDSNETDWILQAGRAHIDHLDLFLLDDQGRQLHHWRHGDQVSWSERPYPHSNLLFPLELETQKSYQLMIRTSSTGGIEMPMSLHTPYGFQQYDAAIQKFIGLYLGAILVTLLFNLLLFIAIRDSSYLMYVLYIACLLLYLASRESLTFSWFWPEQPWLNNHVQAASAIAGLGFFSLFANAFLQLKKSLPVISRGLIFFGGGLLVAALLSPLIEVGLVLRTVTLTAALLIAFVTAVTIIQIRAGYRPACYFFLSSAPLAIMIFLYVLKTYSFIDSSWLLDHGFEVGSTLEAWLLSFALAYRFTMLRDENEKIQQQATLELEQRVLERTKELHDALNARSEFLAVMSHEIRTPLHAILGTVDVLKDGMNSQKQKQQLYIVEQSGNTLLALINDILDYASIERGKLALRNEPFSLPGLANETVGIYQHNADTKGIKLELKLAPELGTLCMGDPLRVRQILGNLVSNAIKFTEQGGVTVTLQRDQRNSDYVLFEVQDSGIGIPAEHTEKIFELFQQSDHSTTRRYRGTGLGLAICKQLAELIGGEIGVTSALGKGSTFWFRLPLPHTSPNEIQQQAAEKNHEAGKLASVRLLIVDDNHVNLLVAEGLARKLGHEVEVAESGAEAIAVLLNDSSPYDLILMDCEMPKIDGFETTVEILRLQNEGKIAPIPIVALTAHAVPDKIQACHDAGMISHIAKPINSEKLSQELNRILHLNEL